jgi:hypothetical protein
LHRDAGLGGVVAGGGRVAVCPGVGGAGVPPRRRQLGGRRLPGWLLSGPLGVGLLAVSWQRPTSLSWKPMRGTLGW